MEGHDKAGGVKHDGAGERLDKAGGVKHDRAGLPPARDT